MDETEDGEFALEASTLDPATHNEMLMMYEEAANSIRFLKRAQWLVLGGALGLLFALLPIAFAFQDWQFIIRIIIIGAIMLTTVTCYTLILFQIGQYTERAKLVMTSQHLSNLLRQIRGLTSPRESAFYRYTLLTFMNAALIAACALVVVLLNRFL